MATPTLIDRIRVRALIAAKTVKRNIRNVFMIPKTSFEAELNGAGLTIAAFLDRRRAGGPRQMIELSRPHLDALQAIDPQRVATLETDCARILRHEFDLLGSGIFRSVDAQRKPHASGYAPIDWYCDPVRNLHFPRGVPHKEWKLYEMRPANADVKHLWELARCQHWVTLAQGWALFRDPRYAREIADQLNDFLEVNATGSGVNWTCTMDVGLRAISWCLALALLHDCQELDHAFWLRAYSALFEHARFIYMNLENTYEVTSNHFLANVIGLHVLSAELEGIPEAATWDGFCRTALETEILAQVYLDGADYESGLPYHRLVTEMFMTSGRLAQIQGRPLSDTYAARLGDMVAYADAMTRPDGLMPVIGDADDGRCQIFSDYGSWNRQDARHLFAPAALTLQRPDLGACASDVGPWEATWWGFDPKDAPRGFAPKTYSKLFADIGHAAARTESAFLVVTNGIVGTKGFGNHKHNELLGFEYCARGVPVFVDPGSYVYTCDFAARNLFRGTGYHNTVLVDGEEQNETNPEWIFRLFEKANPEHVSFEDAEGVVRYVGLHTGYTRFENPVTHERAFAFTKASAKLQIEDRLTGVGVHRFQWRFHAAPHVELYPAEPGRVRVQTSAGLLELRYDPRLKVRVVPAWYAPSYGARVGCSALELTLEADVSTPLDVAFHIEPV